MTPDGTATEVAKNLGGRPRHGQLPKTKSLNLKTTPDIRNMLEAAAAASGRSLSREIEVRLEASLGIASPVCIQFLDVESFERYLRAAVANGALK